jgi:hypothetical protein
MEQSSGRGVAQHPFDRWAPMAVLLIAAAMLVARLWLVFQRLYDPDELEHLHAGYCVWRGMVPYRDFFEQHQPVLWYLSVPLFAIWGPSLEVLFAGRTLIWIGGVCSVGLTWYLGNRFFGRFAGSIAALLLVMHPPYQEKNIEWRPDNLAVPLVLVAVLCLERSLLRSGLRWTVLAGVSFAAAYFCTQKVVYSGVGMVAAFCWLVSRMRARGAPGSTVETSQGYGLASVVGSLAIGVALVVAIMLGFFYYQGALARFVDLTFVAPLQWGTSEPTTRYLVNQLASGAVFWGAGLAGCVLVAFACLARPVQSPGAAMVAGGAITHVAGLMHVPAAFYQYYLPVSPLVAMLAAHVLLLFAQRGSSSVSRLALWISAAAGCSATTAALVVRSWITDLPFVWVPLLGGLLCVAMLLYIFQFNRLGLVFALIISLLGTLPYHAVQFWHWRHQEQTRHIQQLMAVTDPDDAFFDGFTGYGALRPHAFYYFWINHHSWPMISVSERTAGIIGALQSPRTRVLLFDQQLAKHLSPDVLQVIEQLYVADMRYSDVPRFIACVRRERPLGDPDPPELAGFRERGATGMLEHSDSSLP